MSAKTESSAGGGAESHEGHRETRPPETVEKRLAAGFVLTFIILLVMSGMAVRNTLQSRASSDWVNQTHAVILELNAVVVSLQRAESYLTAFVLSGGESDFQSWKKSSSAVREHMEVARALMQADPGQKEGFGTVVPYVQKRLGWAEKLAETRQKSGFEPAREMLLAPANAQGMSEVQDKVRLLVGDENRRLQARDQASNLNSRKTRWILYGGTVLNLLLFLGGYVLVRDDLKLRRLHAGILAEANDVLERRVLERTAEITKANDALQVENIERQWAVSSLERHQRHNELIINSVSEGIWVVSKPGFILRSNMAGALHSGLSHEGMVGKRVHQLLHADGAGVEKTDWPAHPVALAMKSAHATQGLKMLLRRHDGTQVPCRCNVQPMLDSGQVVGAIICFQVESA